MLPRMNQPRVIEPVQAASFGALSRQAPDALLALIGLHRSDPRPCKIDLGVGVYRDAGGATPIFASIKEAEKRLLGDQRTKTYLGAEGDIGFVELLAPIVFGDALAAQQHITGIQTPGGTGALRLGAELIARSCPEASVWLGVPTWPNHAPIFREAGLAVRPHPFYNSEIGEVDFDACMTALSETRPGDAILLHGCCHNPTGVQLNADQWRALTNLIVSRDLLPFVDLAYQGLGDGLDADAAGLRQLILSCPAALVAYSCDKNFGLYRERVGALWTSTQRPVDTSLVRDNILVLARSLWSMPPDHGAAITRIVLADPELNTQWRAELDDMRIRINSLRQSLADAHSRLAPLARQRGMFAMLPLKPADVVMLRERDAIYMAESGRINIAGLKGDTVSVFVDAVRPFLDSLQRHDDG